jgi:hypothetical protein
VPTVTSLLAAANQLLVVAPCLGCWRAWRLGDRRAMLRWLAVACAMPLLTIISQGFLGYGALALIAVLMFVVSFSRPRWKGLGVALLIGYVGLSLYVTYMRDRAEIRASVWGGQSLGQRATRLYRTFSAIEWFGLHNQDHLLRIDERLNQNYLAGVAINNLLSGYREYARGETLTQAALAVVPRVIWPEKSIVAGSPGLVTTYTGITFEENTSVGVGQVMEFYINFGTAGVLIGFFVLGGLVALFDMAAAQWLACGDWQRFTLWFLAGLGFLQAGGALSEVTSTVAASIITAFVVSRLVIPIFQAAADLPGRSNPDLVPAERLPYPLWSASQSAASDAGRDIRRVSAQSIEHSQNGTQSLRG